VVTIRESGLDEKRLVAYVVAEHPSVETSTLKDHLQSRLPGYMVPSTIVKLNRLPLTPNGKIDRLALPAPEEAVQKQNYVGPRNAVEEVIVRVWEDLLGIGKVSVHDNFFDLGGHSLLMLRVCTALRQVLDTDFEIVDLFTFPTIHSLALHLSGKGETNKEAAFADVKARIERQKAARGRSNRPLVQRNPE